MSALIMQALCKAFLPSLPMCPLRPLRPLRLVKKLASIKNFSFN
jgi:hypothetical protein